MKYFDVIFHACIFHRISYFDSMRSFWWTKTANLMNGHFSARGLWPNAIEDITTALDHQGEISCNRRWLVEDQGHDRKCDGTSPFWRCSADEWADKHCDGHRIVSWEVDKVVVLKWSKIHLLNVNFNIAPQISLFKLMNILRKLKYSVPSINIPNKICVSWLA